MANPGQFANLPLGCFAHPLDRKAMTTLRQLPGFERALSQLTKHSYARMLETIHMTCSVEAKPEAFPEVTEWARTYAAALDMPCPRIFVQHDPTPSYRIAGTDDPFLVLTSGMLDLLDKDETAALLAHAVSHLHCEHLPYLMACDFMRDFAEHLGAARALLTGIELPLEEWRRWAEFSCDRGAALLLGGTDTLVRMLTKLAGGAPRGYAQPSPAALQAQFNAFEARMKDMKLGRMYRMMMHLDSRRAFAIPRIHEITLWTATDAYAAFRSGHVPASPTPDDECQARWGAFAGFQSETDAEDAPRSSCPFCGEDGCIALKVTGEAKHYAQTAGGFMQEGAKAFGKAAESFFTTFRDSMRKDNPQTPPVTPVDDAPPPPPPPAGS